MNLGIFTAWRHALAKLLFCSLQCKPIAFLTFSLPCCRRRIAVVLFPHGGLGMICKTPAVLTIYVPIHDVLTMVRGVFKMAA